VTPQAEPMLRAPPASRCVPRRPELIGAIKEYIAVHNNDPKPFVWTASANDILQKVIRANRRLSSKKNEALHQVVHNIVQVLRSWHNDRIKENGD